MAAKEKLAEQDVAEDLSA